MYFWPTLQDSDDIDYAVFLYKRSIIQNTHSYLLFSEYEADVLEQLKSELAEKWQVITDQALDAIKMENELQPRMKFTISAQERAFWNYYRPMPGAEPIIVHDENKYYNDCERFFTMMSQTGGICMLSNTKNDLPENAPENAPENTPENAPENVPENAPENPPENPPENTNALDNHPKYMKIAEHFVNYNGDIQIV
ncbi:regulator of G-protein signaling 7-like [Adelges cooleyi]|uniref:regulator of G-protein signaling 7-like n=1 Tax=Adelges cooleyi TaxID=133065 RepID=UPI00217FA941|nr:regulator of G-protein signaling 7-like [Adelges cooleyi]